LGLGVIGVEPSAFFPEVMCFTYSEQADEVPLSNIVARSRKKLLQQQQPPAVL